MSLTTTHLEATSSLSPLKREESWIYDAQYSGVFGNVVKHCLECLLYSLPQSLNERENGEIKS